MPHLPIVSIIGRPNVGKSCLVNRIAGRRAAVVDDQPGVTRDRNYIPAEWCGRRFCAVDTGGLAPGSRESMAKCISHQVDAALAESAAIVFVVEAGVLPSTDDLRIATRLRKLAGNRLILAVNKADAGRRNIEPAEYLSLGCGEPLAISALHGTGVGDLLDCIIAKLPPGEAESPGQELRMAVVGRPNAGKSSLVNKLLGAERMIVDPAPGTTRDAVDSEILYQGRRCIIIDTAGLRAKSRVTQDVEYYCNLRAIDSIKRCDVCVLVIDTPRSLGEQDLKIVEHVRTHRKGLVVCWNKWDIAQKKAATFDQISADARSRFPEIRFAPMIATSAITGQRVNKVLDLALEVLRKMRVRIPQAELEDHVMEWSRTKPHPMMRGISVRILGAKQRPGAFPLFVCYASHAEALQPAYCRYLENKIHGTWDFAGCPVIVEFRNAARPRR